MSRKGRRTERLHRPPSQESPSPSAFAVNCWGSHFCAQYRPLSFAFLPSSVSPSSCLSPLAPDVFARLSNLQLLPYYLFLLPVLFAWNAPLLTLLLQANCQTLLKYSLVCEVPPLLHHRVPTQVQVQHLPHHVVTVSLTLSHQTTSCWGADTFMLSKPS